MSRNTVIWFFIVVIDLLLIVNIENTFDNGDSILHYIQAHQALETPHYFLDMWAKPIFILLAFPFANIGWIGMKLFNLICIIGSAFLLKKIIDHYHINGWYGVFICFFSQSFFLVQSSGLTEPLFTLFLTCIIWLELKDKSVLSFTLLSFLPFIRSEGYIIIIIFIIYGLLKKKLKFIPFITLGTIFYGLIGLLYYHDFFWMFNQNPYSGVEAKYGHGSLSHFIEQLPYVVGLPVFILFGLGLLHFILNIKNYILTKDFFLIYGITIGYITAHSIFWKFGLFHSFGLTRVLIVIIPLVSIIAFRGLLWLERLLGIISYKIVRYTMITFIIIFPFTKNPMAISWENDIKMDSKQLLLQQTNRWLIDQKLNKKPILTNAYYLALLSEKIIDNDNEIIEMKLFYDTNFQFKKESLIIWDSYFAPTDNQVSEELIEDKFNVKKLREFYDDNNYKVVVYQII